MYLVSAAMGLMSCAIGGGNSRLFGLALEIDGLVEDSLGEFMLTGMNNVQVLCGKHKTAMFIEAFDRAKMIGLLSRAKPGAGTYSGLPNRKV